MLLQTTQDVGGSLNVPITNSLRMRQSASPDITRTMGAPTNNLKFTVSMWVKRGAFTSPYPMGLIGGTVASGLGFGNIASVAYGDYLSYCPTGGTHAVVCSNNLMRDPSAWYHVVLQVDTANATAALRARIFVNNIELTQVSNTITLNEANTLNSAASCTIGRWWNGGANYGYFDGLISQVCLVDGLLLSPSSFTAIDSTSGEWKPLLASQIRANVVAAGGWGNNGCMLLFNGTPGATIYDRKASDTDTTGNNWTATNISTTPGSTYDWLIDSPSNGGSGTRPVGNYCTWNPLQAGPQLLFRNGNQEPYGTVNGSYNSVLGTIGVTSGKWYWEYTLINTAGGSILIGVTTPTQDLGPGANTSAWVGNAAGKGVGYAPSGYTSKAGVGQGTFTAYTTNDVIGVALDADAQTVSFYKNGVFVTTIGAIGAYQWFPCVSCYLTTDSASINAGQQPFAFTPPTGFKSLCTSNLPTPTVKDGRSVMSVNTYTGNGGSLIVRDNYATPPTPSVPIPYALMLDKGSAQYLSRAFGVPTSNKICTLSVWLKRTLNRNANYGMLLSSSSGSAAGGDAIAISDSSDKVQVFFNGATGANVAPNNVLDTPSRWVHLVIAIDTTQAVASDRIKIYIDGVWANASFAVSSYPTLNYVLGQLNSNVGSHYIGRDPSSTQNHDCYLADYYFIDGQALLPSSFGQIDVATSLWVPKTYTGTYGANGFHLDFSNSAALGNDVSGNANHWTLNGGITAANQYTDTPTDNYCVLDPLYSYSNVAPSKGNLFISGLTTVQWWVGSTQRFRSGKWYAEFTCTTATTNGGVGVILTSTASGAVMTNSNSAFYALTGFKSVADGSYVAYGATWTVGDVIGIAVDMSGTITYYKNGVSQGATLVPNIAGKEVCFAIVEPSSVSSIGGTWNFGQHTFAFTPPAGFVALNSQNTPAIGGFMPDIIWIKSRSAATNHILMDSVRGFSNVLNTNSLSTETIDANSVIRTLDGGYEVGNSANVNTAGATYVGWSWKVGGTAVTNNAGSIVSQVSANPSVGISVVTYTGTGANATVGHGLGKAPSLILAKSRSLGSNWRVQHSAYGANYYFTLNASDAAIANITPWNNTNPTFNVFSIGTDSSINASGATNVAYCFAEIPGFSKFGSYIGNGSTNGAFVYCGFKPRFILVKESSIAGGHWYIFDTVRDSYNLSGSQLEANLANAEALSVGFDILSNGFKARYNLSPFNASGQTYIFAAFAESPFNYSNAR